MRAMSEPNQNLVTQYLGELDQGDQSAVDRLLPLIYEDLRGLAHRVFQGLPNQTLQPTALVHEAYMRLAKGSTTFESRRHFLDVAAMAMRRLLANQAEKRRTLKRGGGREQVALESDVAIDSSKFIDLVDLDDLLTELAQLSERQARIVELRFLAGLTLDETAEVLEVSARMVSIDWKMARNWLSRKLEDRADHSDDSE